MKISEINLNPIAVLAVMAMLTSCRGVFFNSEVRYNKSLAFQPYDAVIVPGIPFRNGNWDNIMKGRVLWSVYLYRHGIAKNLIYSGSSVYSPYVEAKVMALYAEKLGVRPEHIFIEPKAEHSTENVYYGYRLASGKGFQKVGVATDIFQSRSLLSFLYKLKRKINADIKCLPMQPELVATMPHDDPVINYETARVDSFVALPDRESFFKRLKGTLGGNIQYDE